MSLESKNYVATLEDVARITRDVLEAHKLRTGGVATYLKALIATTQSELGENPRQRAPISNGKLSAEETAEQLAVLETVGARFYGAVVKAAKEKIEGPDRGGLILNRRTGFARSSMTSIRRWVKAGNDITSLVAARTTKAALHVPGRRKGPSVKVLGNRTRRLSAKLVDTLKALAEADKDVAAVFAEPVRAALDRILKRNAGVPRTRGTRITKHELRPS